MKKLQWDSDFWGIDVFHIYNIETLKFDDIFDKKILIQALPNVSDLTFIHKLEENDFKFQESKVTLIKNKFNVQNVNCSQFKPLSVEDLKPYANNIYELYGNNSRYNLFPSEKVNEFYYTWLIKSTVGQMDDECIGYFIDGQLAGFITYKIIENYIVIGLLGVFPSFRGLGISQLLLSYVDKFAEIKSSKGIKVSTQGKNTSAINAYIKNGYQIKSIDHWYYFIKGDFK